MGRKLKLSEVESVLKQLISKQSGKCSICGHHFTARDGGVLDHDHESGFIRGALHRSCNSAEGRIKLVGNRGFKGVSSRDYIIGLGKYLEQHKVPKYPLLHPSHKTADEKRLLTNAKARAARKKKKVN